MAAHLPQGGWEKASPLKEGHGDSGLRPFLAAGGCVGAFWAPPTLGHVWCYRLWALSFPNQVNQYDGHRRNHYLQLTTSSYDQKYSMKLECTFLNMVGVGSVL